MLRTLIALLALVALAPLGLTLLLACLLSSPAQGSHSAVVAAALALQQHLSGSFANVYQDRDPFMEPVIAFWRRSCGTGEGLCQEAQSGSLQCVMFVTAVFWLAHTSLPWVGNANTFWTHYQGLPDWQTVGATTAALGQRGLPQPGDLMVWQGGPFGHIAVVVGVQPPSRSQDGAVTVAQANEAGNRWPPLPSGLPNPAPGNLLTVPLHPDLSVTMEGLPAFAGYQVQGYLRQRSQTSSTPASGKQAATPASLPLPAGLPNSPYVTLAMQDARAAGIDPVLFVRQINAESGFDPAARSPAGAIGIAQFMPTTAAGLGVDPHDPQASLRAAAALMHRYEQDYGGDVARALAAYNAGPAAVTQAQQRCGSAWQRCLPLETQHYLAVILAPAS